MRYVLRTGQTHCYDSSGKKIACGDTGHDGDFRIGTPWPSGRFELQDKTVLDHLTGLTWSQDANIVTFPCTWQEAFVQIEELNREEYGGYRDWRLPNRNELRSLVSYQTRKPALPEDHPFVNVFLGWYWSSTTAAIHPAYAWSVHLEGARMFYGRKDQYQLFWPVRGTGNSILAATGQTQCFDTQGQPIDCSATKQDGALQMGGEWPDPRFSLQSDVIHDHLTGLTWARHCDVSRGPVNWQQALDVVQEANKESLGTINHWRLPNINELASLVDCSAHSPALSQGHPFTGLQDGYWSSTTSFFETDWAWVLYLDKGACGVGYKPGKTFYVWPVTNLKI
ncbi:MAG TPA: DUF1566 domain-containing protein [Desulfocapsa sulfexigens]|nr:DUF1566 domain-containing protein [Desulfocapsa sulfexigens]